MRLRDYVRNTAVTYHHQVGTCKMGVDADAVVDASVMPMAPSGNTNAPSILIGERAADFVQAT